MLSSKVSVYTLPLKGILERTKPVLPSTTLRCCDAYRQEFTLRTFSSFANYRRGNNNPGNSTNRKLPRSRLMQPGRQNKPRSSAGAFGLRRNAVSVFPGDFGDNADMKEGAEREWKKPAKTIEEEDKDRRETTEKIQEIIRREEELKEELKRKRKDKAMHPPPQLTKIDFRGSTYARGARKCASARVWMQPGFGEVTVNRKDFAEYFKRESLREHMIMPFIITETLGKFDVIALVTGGGLSGQAGAIRLGIARCLNNYNPELYRPPLKFKKLLTRDARVVERKKIGKVKSRKSPQWTKR